MIPTGCKRVHSQTLPLILATACWRPVGKQPTALRTDAGFPVVVGIRWREARSPHWKRRPAPRAAFSHSVSLGR